MSFVKKGLARLTQRKESAVHDVEVPEASRVRHMPALDKANVQSGLRAVTAGALAINSARTAVRGKVGKRELDTIERIGLGFAAAGSTLTMVSALLELSSKTRDHES